MPKSIKIYLDPALDADLLADWRRYRHGDGAQAIRDYWRQALVRREQAGSGQGHGIDLAELRAVVVAAVTEAMIGVQIVGKKETGEVVDEELEALEEELEGNLVIE